MIHRKNPSKTYRRVSAIKGHHTKEGRYIIMRSLHHVEGRILVVGWRFVWSEKTKQHLYCVRTHNHFIKGSLSRADKRAYKL